MWFLSLELAHRAHFTVYNKGLEWGRKVEDPEPHHNRIDLLSKYTLHKMAHLLCISYISRTKIEKLSIKKNYKLHVFKIPKQVKIEMKHIKI